MLHRMAERGFGVLSVMEVRIALEGSAAALAAVRASPGQLDAIAKICWIDQDTPFDDQDQLLATDEAFDSAIIDASGNAFLRRCTDGGPADRGLAPRQLRDPEVHDRSGVDLNQIVVQLAGATRWVRGSR